MKVLFEVPLESSEHKSSKFEWLSDSSNRLFLIEAGRRLRTISIGTEPGKVLESANLADGRVCTSFSWNKDGNQLAMVVDKRLIYFWDVRDNDLLHYKPSAKASNDMNANVAKSRAKHIEQIVWSRLTNRVVLGYSTGQLLLCDKERGLAETVVDNSDGVLREISSIESSPYLDVFACITVIYELLVMTFDGEAIFYNQGADQDISIIRFSPSFSIKAKHAPANHATSSSSSSSKQAIESFWLVHDSRANNELYFRLIEMKERHPAEVRPNDTLVHRIEEGEQIVYYEWLEWNNLMVCSESGTISLIQINSQSDKSSTFNLSTTEILELSAKEELAAAEVDEGLKQKSFKSFVLINRTNNRSPTSEHRSEQSSTSCGKSFSFCAMTAYRLFYYELLELDFGYTLEKVDELDLAASLMKIKLSLERLQWSFDSSMLAVQLTNGHILIYRTRLRDQMVVSYGSQTAYLSEAKEVTILDYGLTAGSPDRPESSRSPVDRADAASSPEQSAGKASVIKVDLEPSVLAIGPKHLAIGLNNIVRFYSTRSGKFEFQEEYHSIVSSICLGPRYVGVQFSDSRVKLHPLNCSKLEASPTEDEDGDLLNERYFPDPTKQELISAFTLTEHLLLYCTTSFNLYVFDLRSWSHAQSFNFIKPTGGQTVIRLVPDGRGNKHLCLTESSQRNQCRVFLYDSYRNEMSSFIEHNEMYAKIFSSQLELVPTLRNLKISSIREPNWRLPLDLSRVSGAIWDTDGRSVLLVEKRYIHTFVVLDHTLAREGPTIEWAATVGKQSTYSTLYASHGVISFQTSLGRVINSIADSHDDEAKLAKLSQQIQAVIGRLPKTHANNESSDTVVEVQAEIVHLKLEYLRLIVLIYPLSKCAEICEYIMDDSQFNVAEHLRLPEIDDVVWRQLAARAIFTSNLKFALLVYKRRRAQVFARGLADIMEDCCKFEFDSKTVVTNRLLILLGCDLDDD